MTSSPELTQFRHRDLQFLLSRHPADCLTCDVSGDCRLQSVAWKLGVKDEPLAPRLLRGFVRDTTAMGSQRQAQLSDWVPTAQSSLTLPHKESIKRHIQDLNEGCSTHQHLIHDQSSRSISRDVTKCIDCGLCADACSAQKIFAIGFAERSYERVPVTVFDQPLAKTKCISCGQCTLVCPTGALTERFDWRYVLNKLESRSFAPEPKSSQPGQALVHVQGDQENLGSKMIVQIAPATRVALSEEFFLPPGSVSTGRMISALRQLGFDLVFDTNFAADLTIIEESAELLERLATSEISIRNNYLPNNMLHSNVPESGAAQQGHPNNTIIRELLPMFTSCCPGWINLVERSFPHLIPRISTTKSPQSMLGALMRRMFGRNAFIISIMPCTAKKDEISRPGLRGDIDAVLTTRELAKMIRARRINFLSLDETAKFDDPLGESSGAAQLFATTGGVSEAMLRTLRALKKEYPTGSFVDLLRLLKAKMGAGVSQSSHKLSSVSVSNQLNQKSNSDTSSRENENLVLANKTDTQLTDFQSGSLPVEKVSCAHSESLLKISKPGAEATYETIPGTKVVDSPGLGSVLILNGSAAAVNLLSRPDCEQILSRFIACEVMACEGGCLAGGGEPKSMDADIAAKRAKATRLIDARASIRTSLENESIKRVYGMFNAEPLSTWSEGLLHSTSYAAYGSKRSMLAKFLDCVDRRDGQGALNLFTKDGTWNHLAHENIKNYIENELPAQSTDPPRRHSFMDTMSMKVTGSNGENCDFDVTLDEDASKIRSLRRVPIKVSG